MLRHCFALVILGFLFGIVQGQESKEEIERLKERTLEEINYANAILKETKGKKEASLHDLSIINHLLAKRREYLKELENESHAISLTINENAGRIDNVREIIERIKENYAGMIVSAYKNRRKNYLFMYLLAAQNMNQAYKRYRYMKIYNDYQRREIKRLDELNEELTIRNDTLKSMYYEMEKIIEEVNAENRKIKEETAEKNNIIAELEKREKELIQEIRDKEAVAERLEKELTTIIEEERKKAKNIALIESLTPEERLISDEFGKNKGRLPWPTERGIVTGKYGEHTHPDYKAVKVRNGGIYISTVPGGEIHTIFKGVVSRVFSIPGENNTVIIKHGEYFTLYHNLINVKVAQNQEVETGQLIGNVYTDSRTRESILYFQVWKEEHTNDPEDWLSSDK